MLWTTGPSPSRSARGRGCFRTEKKKKAAMKRASEKKKRKKLSMPYPLGLPPDLRRPRVIVYHRLPGRRTARVTHAHPNIYSAVQTIVCMCFENTLTSRFARLSISPFDFPPSNCVTLGLCTVRC